jgi:hypothetical protein
LQARFISEGTGERLFKAQQHLHVWDQRINGSTRLSSVGSMWRAGDHSQGKGIEIHDSSFRDGELPGKTIPAVVFHGEAMNWANGGDSEHPFLPQEFIALRHDIVPQTQTAKLKRGLVLVLRVRAESIWSNLPDVPPGLCNSRGRDCQWMQSLRGEAR